MFNKIEKKEVICSKCGYGWETKSKMIFVSCPNCNNKVRVIEKEMSSDHGTRNSREIDN